MAVKFNHTIVSSRDKRASATFLAGILGLPGPVQWGPFQVVRTDNDANIDFIDAEQEITPQHYARKSRRSTITMEAGASISKIQTVTSWRSSPVPMGAAAAPPHPSGPSTRRHRRKRAWPSSYPILADAGSCPGNCSGMEEATGAPSSLAV